MNRHKLMLGDNIQSLKKLPDNSIDSVVTDPPYGLSFMNKKWDYDVPSVDFWKEVYRVLKPGGHILSFGGTRTYHRMVVNIEDAGFEIRDQIMWLYGSGFPKSHNIGKAVDKIEGNEREFIGTKTSGIGKAFTKDGWGTGNDEVEITKGNSPYEGWGTALKPANEPICLARKPLSEKSVAENVLKWGTGGINVDGCRVGSEGGTMFGGGKGKPTNDIKELNEGRFPANLILECICDEGDTHTNPNCPCYILDEQSYSASRFFYQAKVSKAERNMGLDAFEEKETQQKGHGLDRVCMNEGCGVSMLKPELCNCEEPDWRPRPKKNNHPTIKPINLMTHLCRLITPENGIVLDPFMGSGSTGIAAQLEGFRFCGMEMDPDYFKIAEARINSFEKYRKFIK